MNSVKIEQKFKEIFTDCKVNKIIFIGGMTNKNYLVVCDNDKFVFRFPRKMQIA